MLLLSMKGDCTIINHVTSCFPCVQLLFAKSTLIVLKFINSNLILMPRLKIRVQKDRQNRPNLKVILRLQKTVYG